MIPYYSPNFGIFAFLRTLFIVNPEKKLIREFQKISGKKYILVTNSCRSALYLTYKSIDKKGEVITTPLTCKVAIDPIVASGNKPVFADVQLNTLLMNPDLVAGKISRNTLGIQIVHFGGFCCDTGKIEKVARENNLFLVEDCAQGLFSSYKNKPAGTIGDSVCFSLIKNAYGIGGGILATNDESIFRKSLKLQQLMDKPSKKLIYFRIARNIIESYRKYGWGEKLYRKFMLVRTKVKTSSEHDDVLDELKLKKPSKIELKIAVRQFSRAKKLNSKRKENGMQLLKELTSKKVISNYSAIEDFDSPFVKFYAYNEKFDSHKHIPALNKNGVEAKHLEQMFNNQVQERFANINEQELISLPNYNKIHDNLISLPLTEGKMDVDFIANQVLELSNKVKTPTN